MYAMNLSDVLAKVPSELHELYRQHWKTIQTSVRHGIFKDVYHFPLIGARDEIDLKLTEVLLKYKRPIKINIAFGFILRNRGTDDLKFYHPSNNTMLLDTPKLISTPEDRQELLDDVNREDALEYARQQRPSTNWTVEAIICVRFDVTNLQI